MPTDTITGLRRRLAAQTARWIPPGGVGRNATWSFGGQAIGLLATLVATPIQLSRMGSERYGVVVVTAATVSTMLFLDGGASWAVMRFVPWHRARGDHVRARRLAASGLLFASVAGCILGAAAWLLTPNLVDLFRLSASLRPEAVAALHVAAFTVPLAAMSGVAIALARAADQFAAASIALAFLMVALNVVWALVAGDSNDVVLVARAQLVITAILVLFLLTVVGLRARSYLFPMRPSANSLRELLVFGGKTSIAAGSLVLLYQADKVVLATVLPVSVLPTYSIPFSIAIRITVVSGALAGVLLPRLSAISSRADLGELRRVATTGLRFLSVAAPAVAIICTFGGGAFLKLWVGHDFATDASGPLVALAVGFAAFATGSVGITMLDAAGRPGVSAAVVATGTAIGLGSAAGLASAFGTGLSAAIGIASGLVVIGVGALELSRRLVLNVPRQAVLRVVGRPWLSLGAAGGAAFAVSSALSAPAAVTLALVASATTVTALRGAYAGAADQHPVAANLPE